MIVVPEVVAFGGAERSVLALCRWLHTRGLKHRIVSYWDRIGLARHVSFPLTMTELNPRPHPLAKVRSLRRFAWGHPGGSILMSGYQAALHASLAGIGHFHTLMHDTPSLFDNGPNPSRSAALRDAITTKALGLGLQRGGRTIVTSEFLKAESDRLYGTDAIIIRMGGPGSASTFRPRRVDGQLRLLSVSRVEANKRIDWILRALASLQNLPAWRLDIVGDGSARSELHDLCRQLGLGDRVSFYGFVSDAVVETLYDAAHLFLMPARQGYGIPAIEALQRGIPVLVHRDSGVSDILRATPWCTVIEGGEGALAASLAQAIAAAVAGHQLGQPLPAFPTEDDWAAAVAAACGWI